MILNKFQVLSDKEVSRIHESSLYLLEKVGILTHSEKVLKLLQEGGAKVDLNSELAKIPPLLVRKALNSAPSQFILYDRNKRPSFTLGDGTSHFASGHNAIYVCGESGKRRKATKDDVAKFARLSDALENIHVVGIQAMPQDVLPEASLIHAVDATFNNTKKHIFFSPERVEVTQAILDLSKVVAGEDDLSRHPIATCQLSPTSPLTWEPGSAESLLVVAEAGIPCCILPEPIAGVSAPLTLAGLLVVHNAEFLSGLVISQLTKKGSPVIYGSAWTTFDMKDGNVMLGSPEAALMRITGAQMANYYGIPSHNTGPNSDSHCMDERMGWEKCLTLLSAVNSRINLILDAGIFAAGYTVSFEQVLLDAEMIGMLLRYSQGIEVSPDTIALDVIEQVGPGGQFIVEEHTLRYLRSQEHWQPFLTPREIYSKWEEKGYRNIVQLAQNRTAQIIAGHRPESLNRKIKQKMKKIIDDFEDSVGLG